jgi:tRNA (guanine37-N1)-methyltransferase
MDTALDPLLPLLSTRGTAHFYTFKTRQEIPDCIAAYTARGLDVTYSAACGNVAPGVSRTVFDLVWRR